MGTYIIKRIFASLIAIIGAATLVFFMIRISGDPVLNMLPPEAPEEQIVALRESLGYNQPLWKQYSDMIVGIAQGDLGESTHYQQDALSLVVERLPATLSLAGIAIAISSVIGIFVGTLAAARRNGIFDMVSNLFVMAGQAVPVFWLSILMIELFATQLHLVPTSGTDGWTSYILPAAALACYPAASITRLMRSSMLDVLSQDYIRTARAKGMMGWCVVMSQAIKNALIPVITVIGMEFGSLLGGAVVTETIFAWPGVGRLMVLAVSNRDFPLVQACVLVISFLFVFVNFMVDISYTALDPRIKRS